MYHVNEVSQTDAKFPQFYRFIMVSVSLLLHVYLSFILPHCSFSISLKTHNVTSIGHMTACLLKLSMKIGL